MLTNLDPLQHVVYLLSGVVTHFRLRDQAIIDCLLRKVSARETKASEIQKIYFPVYDQLSFCPILKVVN